MKLNYLSLAIIFGIVTVTGNIASCFAQAPSQHSQVQSPELRTLTQLIRQGFEGFKTHNTRAYTIFGNGGQNFPVDANAGLPVPHNVVGPVRTSIFSSGAGSYPQTYSVQKSPMEIPGWKPSNVNPYSYMLGHQGRADFSQEEESPIITVDDLKDDSFVGSPREIQIQSSMSFKK